MAAVMVFKSHNPGSEKPFADDSRKWASVPSVRSRDCIHLPRSIPSSRSCHLRDLGGKYNRANLSQILMFVDEKLNVLDRSSADPKFFGPYIHALFAQGSPSVHRSLLKLICRLKFVFPR